MPCESSARRPISKPERTRWQTGRAPGVGDACSQRTSIRGRAGLDAPGSHHRDRQLPALQAGPVVDSTAVGTAMCISAAYPNLSRTTAATGMKQQQDSGNNAIHGSARANSALVTCIVVSASNSHRSHSPPHVANRPGHLSTLRATHRIQLGSARSARKTGS